MNDWVLVLLGGAAGAALVVIWKIYAELVTIRQSVEKLLRNQG